VYRIPCEAFPDFVVYAHLVLGAGPPTLVDTGSGYGQSNDHLREGFARLRSEFSERAGLADVRRVIITHGHVDHFGGLAFVLDHCQAEVAVHGLDRRVLVAYEERVVMATRALRAFLDLAGVPADVCQRLMAMYGFSKRHVHSTRVDRILSDGDVVDGMEVRHVPGHCPGQVVLVLGNVLLSADHVLARTSPHQAPESITAWMGLGHYLESLARLRGLEGIEMALGGHEEPITDLGRRIDQLEFGHRRKLDKVLGLIRESSEPPTIWELTGRMYPKAKGFHELLAVEEAGAHVEFLDQRGDLAVANLEEMESDSRPAVRYRAT
jgi:glyoxylase-like metal-dependent hydrolase (beta-lactamase superfamily II)